MINYYFGLMRYPILLFALITITVGDFIHASDVSFTTKEKIDEVRCKAFGCGAALQARFILTLICSSSIQVDELNAKKLAIHALASQLAKDSSPPFDHAQRSRSVTTTDIEQAGLGKGASQRLATSDPRNHGSRFGWLFGAAVPQKSAPSLLAAHSTVHAQSVASLADQNSTNSLPDDDDIEEVPTAAPQPCPLRFDVLITERADFFASREPPRLTPSRYPRTRKFGLSSGWASSSSQ
jgi:hypothetical protein